MGVKRVLQGYQPKGGQKSSDIKPPKGWTGASSGAPAVPIPMQLIEQEGTVLVTRTHLKQTKEKTKKIRVRPFVTYPVYVTVKFGVTIPTVQFGGARADITISMPCYREEWPQVYKEVRDIVDRLIDKEAERFEVKDDES